MSLRSELKSQSYEEIRLNGQKTPVLKVIAQDRKIKTNGAHEGTIKIQVMRPNNFASFKVTSSLHSKQYLR